ncbi:OmpA family protein [Pseudanabaena mucicola]|uniref:OmpA family protein n=1 Tax=Pseudanabaena mucicola FACHB-723 TaxID=2692860 RepID=A0ABR7ZVX0_9CYAN|nr:OmpA family protein [Pseudanabaena mucicola]MBD2187543.1 OmpA family protein [Pseudanabaena mucicola FACHB-723]
MTNLPTPDKSIGKSSGKPSGNLGQAGRTAMTWIIRSAVLGIGAIAGLGIGLAIAIARPELVWQPSFDFLNYKKQQFTLSSEALFDPNKSSIRPESFRLLDEVAAQLPLATGKRIRISGHMELSKNGDELTLSYLRASAVKEYLARLRGEQTYSWMVVGYGASRPITSSDANNRQSNSRIEIFVDD